MRQMTVRGVRKQAEGMAGEWVAVEAADQSGYTLRCGDVELCTVNSKRPRVFRSLDTAKQALRDEMGITRFAVEAVKM